MKSRKLKLIQQAECEYECTQRKCGVSIYGIEWETCQYGKDFCSGCSTPNFTRKGFSKVRNERKYDKFMKRMNRLIEDYAQGIFS